LITALPRSVAKARRAKGGAERREGEECGGRSGARGAEGGAARRKARRDDRSDRARRAATTGAPSPSERVAATIGVLIDMFLRREGAFLCAFCPLLPAHLKKKN